MREHFVIVAAPRSGMREHFVPLLAQPNRKAHAFRYATEPTRWQDHPIPGTTRFRIHDTASMENRLGKHISFPSSK